MSIKYKGNNIAAKNCRIAILTLLERSSDSSMANFVSESNRDFRRHLAQHPINITD